MFFQKKCSRVKFSITLSAAILIFSTTAFAAPLIKSGESIAFLGDSITAQGYGKPAGYVRLVINGLKANGMDVRCFPAGVSGHKSNQMLARLKRDVLKKKPTWMTLSCGVNDVWHGQRGVPLDKYKVNITEIVDKAQSDGIKVMILTATMIREDENNKLNKILDSYNVFLRQLAKEKGCLLADLSRDMKAKLKEMRGDRKGNLLTVDGVHMNIDGDIMMAKGILRTFGLDDAMIKKAELSWDKIPFACRIRLYPSVTIPEFRELRKIAKERKTTVGGLLNKMVIGEIKALLEKQEK